MPLSAGAEEADPAPMTVPVIRVTTEGGNGTELQKADGYVNAEITITDVDGSTLSDSVQFKVRGNTTAMDFVQKKAFTFKFSKKKDVLDATRIQRYLAGFTVEGSFGQYFDYPAEEA